VKAVNVDTGLLLGSNIRLARGPIQKGLGLLGRADLPDGEGLLIPSCRAITTFFMRFPIDVLFLDPDGFVVTLLQGLKPWRNAFGDRAATMVLELPAGTLVRSGTQVGHRVVFSP
jgi:uncharacterized membrane protein (UPF0127 family)